MDSRSYSESYVIRWAGVSFPMNDDIHVQTATLISSGIYQPRLHFILAFKGLLLCNFEVNKSYMRKRNYFWSFPVSNTLEIPCVETGFQTSPLYLSAQLRLPFFSLLTSARVPQKGFFCLWTLRALGNHANIFEWL